TGVPAVRAAVLAEVADVRGGVLVRGSTADAVLGVGRVLQRRPRDRRIVDAEDDRARAVAGELADLRVVAVQDEGRFRRELPDGGAPAGRDVLQLPVTVELVAEEVPETDRARPNPRGHLRQGRLVHLEQPQLGAAGV